ncbi:MAG: toxin HipA [bacterium]|nr:toxin HipA [bacterium]
MRQARVAMHGTPAGVLKEIEKKRAYEFVYHEDYKGPPISLTMPLEKGNYSFASFPPFFEGLLPEGIQLEGLLRTQKIDADDYFAQLTAVGGDLVGAVTVEVIP